MSPKKSAAASMDENPSEISTATTKKKCREKKPKLPRKPRPQKTKSLKPLNIIKVKLKPPKPKAVSNIFACPLAAALEEKEFPDTARHLPPAAFITLANEVARVQLAKRPACQPTSPLTNGVSQSPSLLTSTPQSSEGPSALRLCRGPWIKMPPAKMSPAEVPPVKTAPVKKKQARKRKTSNKDMIDDVDGAIPSPSKNNAVPSLSLVDTKQTASKVKKAAVRRVRKPMIAPVNIVETNNTEVSAPSDSIAVNSDVDYKPPEKKAKETVQKKPAKKRVRNPSKTKSKQPAKLVTAVKEPDRNEAPVGSITTDSDEQKLDAHYKPTEKKRRGRPKKIILPDTHEIQSNTSCPAADNKEMPQTANIPVKKKRDRKKEVINHSESENQSLVQEVTKSSSKFSNNLQEAKGTCSPRNMLPAKITINGTEQNDQPSRTDSIKTSVSDTFSWALDISSTSSMQSRELCPKDVKIILAKIDSPHSDKLASIQNKSVVNGDLVATNNTIKRQKQPNKIIKKIVASEPSTLISGSLSTSDSLSSSKSSTTISSKASAIQKLTQIRENLGQIKSSLDEEFYIWIGDDNTTDQDIDRLVQVNSFEVQVLKPELEFIRNCQIRRNSKKPSNNATNDCGNVHDTVLDNIESLPQVEPELYPTEVTDIPVCSNKDFVNDESFSDIVRRKTNEDSYLDDDVISLFATESLNGDMESRQSIVVSPREFDDNLDETLGDEPVKTQFEFTKPNKVPNTPVRRQEANKLDKEMVLPDSTSKPNNASLDQKLKRTIVLTNDKPILIEDRFSPANALKVRLFKGVCFYNLISHCRRLNCWYPHNIPSDMEIRQTMQVMREGDLVSEYMLVRNYPMLRSRLAAAFADAYDQRGMTNYLLEIVKDTCREVEQLQTDIRERTLLHLNSRNLNDSADLLKIPTHNNELLCDTLMRAMAATTNFTRFKPVFVKLTSFMTQVGRSFALDVATMLLERVLILPFEKALASSLVAILKNTDRSILQNSHISKFLNLLKKHDQTDLLNDLEQYMVEPNPPKVTREPPKVVNVQYPAENAESHKRYTSPDTTHWEQNKPVQEPLPLPTRTLHLHRVPPSSGDTSNFNNTPSPSSGNRLNFNAAKATLGVRQLHNNHQRVPPWPPRTDEWMFTPNRMTMYQRGHGVRHRGQGRMKTGFHPRGHRGGLYPGPERFPRRLPIEWDGYRYPPPPPPP